MTAHQIELLEFLRNSVPTPAAKLLLTRTLQEFVLEYGWWYEPAEAPKHFPSGTQQHCHKNAFDLTLTDNFLIYCEGFALFETGMTPTIHAWVTDRQGRAIDNTWAKPGVAYAGIPFKSLFVAMTALTNHATISLLDDWQNKYPLRGDLGDRPDEWLELRGRGGGTSQRWRLQMTWAKQPDDRKPITKEQARQKSQKENPETGKRPTKSDLLFQFKITLVGMKPPIWRRIEVRDCTLGDLHDIIQVVMGWEDGHMHQFLVNGERYAPFPSDFDLEFNDENKLRLSQIVPKSGKRIRFKYEYDFGDGWLHEIAFERFVEPEAKAKYPRCVAGARSGPPEDVGGVWGYKGFLEALADPEHDRHEEFLEWGGEWDAEKFSVESVNKGLRGFSRR